MYKSENRGSSNQPQETNKIVAEMIAGTRSHKIQIPEYEKRTLIERLRKRDKPLLASSKAHGPG